MTNQEILTKALEKAIDGGWKVLDGREWNVHKAGAYSGWYVCLPDHATKTKIHLSVADVIFSHDFAKALWGKELKATGLMIALVAKEQSIYKQVFILAWMYHLQQMVIADDPIAYLGEHI